MNLKPGRADKFECWLEKAKGVNYAEEDTL